MHESRSKNLSLTLKDKHFLLGQYTTVYFKTRKANSALFLNFRSDEAHINVRGVLQI